MIIQDWIKENHLQVEWSEDGRVLKIEEDNYFIVEGKKDKPIFSPEFELLLTDEEETFLEIYKCKYQVFEFGDFWFYSKIGSPIKMDFFKYLGRSDEKGFTYLGIHGGYELNNGSRDYSDWCKKAKFLGINSLAVCERNTLGGTLKFQDACKAKGIKSIIGETVSVKRKDKSVYQIKLFCLNEKGWNNLLWINKAINVDNGGFVEEEYLLKRLKDLVCVIQYGTKLDEHFIDSFKSQEIYYQIDPVEFLNNNRDKNNLDSLKDYFNNWQVFISPILICDSYYLDQSEYKIKDFLNVVGKTSTEGQSKDQYFKSIKDVENGIRSWFEDENRFKKFIDQCLRPLESIVERCSFEIKTGQRHLPVYELSEKEKAIYSSKEELFWGLIEKGLEEKVIKRGLDEKIYLERVEKEVDVFEYAGITDYFLIIHDIYNYCEENGIITGLGRGSVAGSLISHLLNISRIDPIEYGLLFERFINKDRAVKSLPDIDSDFPGSRRDEVKRYIEQRFGIDQVCSVGTYGTYKIRSSFKDACKIGGVDPARANYFSTMLKSDTDYESWEYNSLLTEVVKNDQFKDFVQQIYEQVNYIPLCIGQPKNTSVHASAVLITPKEDKSGNKMTIYDWIPVKKIDGILVSEWEGSELETAGFLKEDVLGVRQLDKIDNIQKLIKENGKEVPPFDDTLDLEDKKVLERVSQGYNQDIFHFGSPGLTGYCQQVKPWKFDELPAIVSIYRPGAMEANAHRDFVNIKFGRREEHYDFGLKEITKETYGLLIYQEQIMKATQVLGGLTLVEADDVRRAMGKVDIKKIKPYKERFINSAIEKGCPLFEAESIWNKLEAFAKYGFNKCLGKDERILRVGHTYTGRSIYNPTIGEMYKIKNDRKYAKKSGHLALYSKYRSSYGMAFSLNEKNRLIRNKIKDIRFQGKRSIYEIEVITGEKIRVTDNHKFPTQRGEIITDNLIVGEDNLFINRGYERQDTAFRFNTNLKNYPEKGQNGFQILDTKYTKWKKSKEESRSVKNCQDCGKEHKRLELHHKDGDHGNNEPENLIVLCPSCHKKEEYKIGRIKMGQKGLLTQLVLIKSITYIGEEEVYDIEMEIPYHSFTTGEGVVTCNSHAVCYAATGYYTQYLKVHHPMEFWTVSLQFSKDDEIPERVNEIYRTSSNITLSPPDINNSQLKFIPDYGTSTIYWSINSITRVGGVAVEVILTEREKNGKFFSLQEFLSRVEKRKVNKACVTNLILAGCFDKLENIKDIRDRKTLLVKYYQSIRQEIPNEFIAQDSNKEWYWYLQQKLVSGSGFFDYKKLYSQIKLDYIEQLFVTPDRIALEDNLEQTCITAGILKEIQIKKSKKGEFGHLTLDQNNAPVEVTFWNESWMKYRDELIGNENKLVAVKGKIVFDKWRSKNTIQSQPDTELQVL